MSIGTVQESIPVWRELAKHPFDRGCVLLASMLSRAADEVEKALAENVRLAGELAHVSRSLAWQQDERIKAEAAVADYQVRLSVSDHDLQFSESTVARQAGLLREAWGFLDPECGHDVEGKCGPACELRCRIDAALGRAIEAETEVKS